ncbi:MAG: ubiquinol-cytochrome c reductase iron-sulfur subunit [Bacteroidota bacterium]
MKVTRREFFSKAAKGGAALIAAPALLTSFLESCGSSSTGPQSGTPNISTVQGSEANGILTINIDSGSPLAKAGTAAMASSSVGILLIDHPTDNTFNVLSSVCTHQSCQINNFDSGSSQFICNCHGSHFDVNGQVTQGPARSPLAKYTSQFSNSKLTIQL